MNRKNNLENSVKPIYEFTFGNRSRRTDNLEYGNKVGTAGIELLAEFGREDPGAEVELVGYES